MAPTLILSHYVWAGLVLLCAIVVRRKARQTDTQMLEPFWKFFATWSLLFFGPLAVLLHIGWLLERPAVMTVGYVLPHLFAFIAISYLWQVQSSITLPSYRKYYRLFIGYGIIVVAYGLYERPEVFVEGGRIVFGPGSTFSTLIPLGMTVSAALIAGSSFYSAYILEETSSRIKLGLIGIGTVFSLVFASLFHNLGYPLFGELANLAWIACFMTVAYWQEISSAVR